MFCLSNMLKFMQNQAFHDFLPTTVVRDLKKKKILAENFSCVTIFFGDIIGFNELTSDCSANEVGFRQARAQGFTAIPAHP